MIKAVIICNYSIIHTADIYTILLSVSSTNTPIKNNTINDTAVMDKINVYTLSLLKRSSFL